MLKWLSKGKIAAVLAVILALSVVAASPGFAKKHKGSGGSSSGMVGPQGPAGPRGPAGATNVTVQVGTGTTVPAGSTNGDTASCPAGQKATGGGFNVPSATSPPVYDSSPTPNDTGSTPTGWEAFLDN